MIFNNYFFVPYVLSIFACNAIIKDVLFILNIFLVLSVMLEFLPDISQIICTSQGGIINLVTWYKNDKMITSEDPNFSQSMVIPNRSTPTTQLVLFSRNIYNFQGTFCCKIMDGNGRITSSIPKLFGKFGT